MDREFDPIEKEIIALFKKLSKEKPNVSYVYSYVYSVNDPNEKAKVEGATNLHGSLEEVIIHVEGLQQKIEEEKQKQEKKKEKIYGKKKDTKS